MQDGDSSADEGHHHCCLCNCETESSNDAGSEEGSCGRMTATDRRMEMENESDANSESPRMEMEDENQMENEAETDDSVMELEQEHQKDIEAESDNSEMETGNEHQNENEAENLISAKSSNKPTGKMAGHIIRPLEERHVASKVDLMVWSNKMDLIALSNSKGEIALHRLTWQRVWLLPPPSPHLTVRKIAWRPDGRVIAIAYVPKVMTVGRRVNAEVLLLDVENKDVLHVINVSDDVSCLLWLQEKQLQDHHQNFSGPSHNQDGTSDFLPKLPSLSRTFGSLPDSNEENLEDAKRIKDQTQLNFLMIATCDGNIYMSVFGLFSCGIININRYMTENEEGKHCSVLHAEMSSDMKTLIFLVAVDQEKFYAETMKDENETSKKRKKTQAEDENEISKSETVIKTPKTGKILTRNRETQTEDDPHPDNEVDDNSDSSDGNADENVKKSKSKKSERKRELKIVILDTRVLSSRSRELHALSLKHGHVMSLLDYLSQTMRSIIEAWENIYLLEIESKLSEHAECLPEGSLSADFLELLLFGVASDSLEDFLLNELNDKGIKKLGHSIELSHSNIQKLILKHLLSVGQSLAYHLAEMKGMAKLADRFKVLGLEEETVSEAFSAAGAFLIKATEVQLVIDDSMKRYKAFFRWLYAIILRIADDRIPDLTMCDINQQDLEFIADYLHKLDVKTDENGIRRRHCYLDRLGQYLVNRDLTTPTENDKNNHWQKLLEQNPCLQKHFSVIRRSKHTSLVQQHEHLKAAIDKVFKTPEYAIGNMFQLNTLLTIGQLAYKRLSMTLVEDRLILISMIECESQSVFKMFQIPSDGSIDGIASKSVFFGTHENIVMECLDVQFYTPEIVSILLEEQDESKTAVIVQLLTKVIYENDQETLDGNAFGDSIVLREIGGLVASSFAVSGSRKVAIVLSESRRKVRLFEMEAEDDDEDEESQTDPPPALYEVLENKKTFSTTDNTEDKQWDENDPELAIITTFLDDNFPNQHLENDVFNQQSGESQNEEGQEDN